MPIEHGHRVPTADKYIGLTSRICAPFPHYSTLTIVLETLLHLHLYTKAAVIMSATVLRATPICRAAQHSARSLRTVPASVLGRNLGRCSTFRAPTVADSFSSRIAASRYISQSSKDKVKERKKAIPIEERVKQIVVDQLGVKAEEVRRCKLPRTATRLFNTFTDLHR